MRCLGLILLLAATSFAQARKATILGKVVDKDGKPVEGASVASLWLEGQPAGGTLTGKDGKFTLMVDFYGRPVAILVKDKERKRGIVSRFSKKSFDKERTLELEKLVTVKGAFTCKELKTVPPWTNMYLNYLPGRIRLARFMSEKAMFSFTVPEGEYQLNGYGTDVKGKTWEQFIEEDTDFGEVDLAATELAKMYGKKAPAWTVTAARGAKNNVSLKDFKGKFLLIEFWGFW